MISPRGQLLVSWPAAGAAILYVLAIAALAVGDSLIWPGGQGLGQHGRRRT